MDAVHLVIMKTMQIVDMRQGIERGGQLQLGPGHMLHIALPPRNKDGMVYLEADGGLYDDAETFRLWADVFDQAARDPDDSLCVLQVSLQIPGNNKDVLCYTAVHTPPHFQIHGKAGKNHSDEVFQTFVDQLRPNMSPIRSAPAS
jgi:hypothetical protein